MTWQDRINEHRMEIKATLIELLNLNRGKRSQHLDSKCHNLLQILSYVCTDLDEYESICHQQLEIIQKRTNMLKQEVAKRKET